MIYPAQTSLIPVQIALARFLEQGGSILGNYPYWYLGSTPYHNLTGPIIPVLLTWFHKILPFFSLFEIFFLVIGISFLIGVFGVYFLVREISKERRTAVLVSGFYFLIPIIPFFFQFSNGLYFIAFSFLPFVFLQYSRFLKHEERKDGILLCLLISFVILLDSLIIPTLILGMGALFLAQVGWKKAEEKAKKSFWLLVFGFLIATLWYTPGYWLTLLGAPSLAGKGSMGVIFELGKLLPTVLAFGIAIVSVKFFKKKNSFRDFAFYWLFIFGFLTLLRFLSDPDFWLDWIAYSTELQFGLAVLGSYWLSRIKKGREAVSLVISGLLLIAWLLVFDKYVLNTLQQDISQAVEYRISNQLSEIANSGERVFLSGTTAFWLNAFSDIPQVRGGIDQASVDPHWREATWEIREGEKAEKSLDWLRKLGVSYLVVHTQESQEFYHDFKYPEKFEGVEGLEKVYEEKGDRIYRVLQEKEEN